MFSLLILTAAASGAFAHATPTPSPEIPVEVYRQRRERVLNSLDGCLTVVSAQGEASGVTEDFRQDGDFFWLTGINEPDAHLILAPKSRYQKTTLYLKSRDPEAERWTGPREPVSPALLTKYGVDKVRRGIPDAALMQAAQDYD